MDRVVKTRIENMISQNLQQKGLEYYRIKSNDGKHVIKGLYHIQNVNGLHSGMKC